MDTPEALKQRASGDSVIVIQSPGENPALQTELAALECDIDHWNNNGKAVSIQTKRPARILNALAALLERQAISNIEVRNATLEDVYVMIIQESDA